MKNVVFVILAVLCTYATAGFLSDSFGIFTDTVKDTIKEVENTANEFTDAVNDVAKEATDTATNFIEKLPEAWLNFKQLNNRTFLDPVKELLHMDFFMKNLKKITEHNKLFDLKKVSFRRVVNKFSDMSLKDFITQTNGFIRDLVEPNTARKEKKLPFFRRVTPPFVDWRERGVNIPVKDQETCASCWSFAAAGAIEAHEIIKHGRVLDLSEQNLVDCAKSNYNAGCMGGHPLYAFNYTMQNKGVSLRMYYPYENVKRQCRYKKVFNSGSYSIAYKRLPKGDEEALKEAVAFVGPIVSAVDGTLDSLRDYGAGIYYDEECSSTGITHAVLIVGYGTQNGEDYWLIKNSLGKYWGEKGYFKLARNKNNHCGIATDASYPIVESIPNYRF